MKSMVTKRWVRVLALVLFCLFAAASALSFFLYSYAWNDGWYSKEFLGFESSGLCSQYIYDCIEYVAENLPWLQDPYNEYMGAYGGAAFSYTITSEATNEITADTRGDNSVFVASICGVLVSKNDDMAVPFETDSDTGEELYLVETESYTLYDVNGYVNLPVSPYDGCYREYAIFQHLYALRQFYLPGGIVLALLALLMLIAALSGAAATGKGGGLAHVMRFPFDATAAILAAGVLIVTYLLCYLQELLCGDMYGFYYLQQGIFAGCGAVGVGLAAYVLAGQLGAGLLWKKLLLRRATATTPQQVLLALFLLVHAVAMQYISSGVFALVLMFADLALVPYFICQAVESRKIQKASGALAEGNLTYKVDTKKLHGVWRTLGGSLNSIGDGMSRAVDEQMRSERLKTELITNVSHDLKTPLTSIISYIDLLKDDNLSMKKCREYIEVLDRQGAKLKKLTEDVVEASRAVSGAVTLEMAPLDAGELLEQSVGEYAERLTAAEIEPVVHVPEAEASVMADGRLLGRVLDNLITNVLKYAQPGTRAYFDLTAEEGQVVIAVKNISREPLDIPADELMERFVRGDRSRSSEGSGLGLSIARSLTELMGGHMALTLDGDLFKAELRFPRLTSPV